MPLEELAADKLLMGGLDAEVEKMNKNRKQQFRYGNDVFSLCCIRFQISNFRLLCFCPGTYLYFLGQFQYARVLFHPFLHIKGISLPRIPYRGFEIFMIIFSSSTYTALPLYYIWLVFQNIKVPKICKFHKTGLIWEVHYGNLPTPTNRVDWYIGVFCISKLQLFQMYYIRDLGVKMIRIS